MISPREFIVNFKSDWDSTYLETVFTQGNCYHFALILESMYDGVIEYDTIRGHFVTRVGKKYYDITGEIEEPETLYTWQTMKNIEPNQYEVLLHDCVYKMKGD